MTHFTEQSLYIVILEFMKAKITYLLGAGASFDAVPIVDYIPDKLKNYLKVIKDPKYSFKNRSFERPNLSGVGIEELRNSYVAELEQLIRECRNHLSIDYYARYLHLKGEFNKLERTKFIFNEFLLYEQKINGVDKRYDGFFASIIKKDSEGNLQLPENINILSWNYDNQIELSYSKFKNTPKPKNISEELQIYPNTRYREYDSDQFCIMKLNGSAGGTIDNDNDKVHPHGFNFETFRDLENQPNMFELLEQLYFRYHEFGKWIIDKAWDEPRFNRLTIFFSWDNNKIYDKLREQAFQIIQNSNILVIIGYSFPTFNRELDKMIFAKMKRLEEIYLQTKKENLDDIMSKIKSLLNRENHITPIESTKEFYIPSEFQIQTKF